MSAARAYTPADHLRSAIAAKTLDVADAALCEFLAHHGSPAHIVDMGATAAAALVGRLRGSEASSTLVSDLARFIATAQREHKAVARGLRLAGDGDEDRDLSAMLHACDAFVPDGLCIPDGFSVHTEAREVWTVPQGEKGVPLLQCRLIVVQAVAIDAEAPDRQTVTLGWFGLAGTWQTATIPRTHAMDRAKLIAMADRGAPVDSTSASRTVQWLAAQLACSAIRPEMSIRRFGWLKGGGFMYGNEGIGMSVSFVAPGDGERGDADALVQRGTREGWMAKVWRPIADLPASLVVLAALASPLLAQLKADGWTLDIGGDSSTGKSTSVAAAVSIYGEPKRLAMPWPRTWAAARSRIELWHSLPAIFDDTKRAMDAGSVIRDVLYAVNDPSSQRLGDGQGGTRASREICTVAISTGEHTAASQCNDARGAMARCITTDEPMIPQGSHDIVASIDAGVVENHGIVGRQWVEWLVTNTAKRHEWRADYRARTAALRRGMATDVDGRIAGFLAHLEVTAHLAGPVLGMDFTAALACARASIEQGAASRDLPTAALEMVIDAQMSQPADLFAPGRTQPRTAWIGGHELHRTRRWTISPAYAREVLKRAGYRDTEMTRAWRRNGWVEHEYQRDTLKITMPDGHRSRYIVLTKEATEHFAGEVDPIDAPVDDYLSYPPDPMNPR